MKRGEIVCYGFMSEPKTHQMKGGQKFCGVLTSIRVNLDEDRTGMSGFDFFVTQDHGDQGYKESFAAFTFRQGDDVGGWTKYSVTLDAFKKLMEEKPKGDSIWNLFNQNSGYEWNDWEYSYLEEAMNKAAEMACREALQPCNIEKGKRSFCKQQDGDLRVQVYYALKKGVNGEPDYIWPCLNKHPDTPKYQEPVEDEDDKFRRAVHEEVVQLKEKGEAQEARIAHLETDLSNLRAKFDCQEGKWQRALENVAHAYVSEIKGIKERMLTKEVV